jgi:hypothetical protein
MSEEKKILSPEEIKELPGLTDQQKKQIACSEEIRTILAKYDLAFSVHPGNIVLVPRPEEMKKSEADKEKKTSDKEK